MVEFIIGLMFGFAGGSMLSYWYISYKNERDDYLKFMQELLNVENSDISAIVRRYRKDD